jgi:hypothetical protein
MFNIERGKSGKPLSKLVVIGSLLVDGLAVVVVVGEGCMNIGKREMGEVSENFVGGLAGLCKHGNIPNPNARSGHTWLSTAHAGRACDVLLGMRNWSNAHISHYIGFCGVWTMKSGNSIGMQLPLRQRSVQATSTSTALSASNVQL